jgi:putative CocE/NonD family hydrolase
VSAPVSFVGGWYDILAPWMLDDVCALQDAGRRPRLLMGPWTHTSPELMAAGHRDAIAFLRAHLLGDECLLESQARALPVRVRTTGEGGEWREFAAWPPPGAGERRWYLGAEGRLGDRAPGGDGEGDVAGAGVEGYRYDPADPTPAYGGPVLMSRTPVVDNGPLESRDDVLTFTTEPLTDALEAIGRPSVEIWARGSEPYFDIFARICEVDAAGVSRNVCDALASVHPDRDAALADGSFCVSFQLWPLGHRFAAGHRIRLQISSGAHPRYARNPGTGADPAGAAPDTMRAVDIQVLRDAQHPSSVRLPEMTAGGRGPNLNPNGAGEPDR